MNGSVFSDVDKLETDSWQAPDNVRANFQLTSSDYFMPILGVIFLRDAATEGETETLARQVYEHGWQQSEAGRQLPDVGAHDHVACLQHGVWSDGTAGEVM